MSINGISLTPATEKDIPYLKEKIIETFAISAVEQFGEKEADRVPHGEQLEQAYRLERSNKASGCRVYCIMKDDIIIGGTVLKINEETWHNKTELFFIFKEHLNKGLGLDAWKAIERKYPQTLVWELDTPYFEKRNIHFYVNKCGFHIVEYFNKYHPDPMMSAPPHDDRHRDMDEFDDGGCFRFAKEMRH